VIDRRENRAVYGAGGGITWDSSAEAEYDEVIAKAAILSESLPRFALLETMALVHGHIERRGLHLDRLGASAHFWDFDPGAVAAADDALARVEHELPDGCWRIRMTVTRSGSVHIARSPLAAPPAPMPTDEGDALTVALAHDPVHSSDLLLHHKTTARAVYEQRRAAAPDTADVLLRNEHGLITEFTTGNLICEIDGRLLTPARDCGLLAGTLRRQLLEAGTVREADIAVDDLARAARMWLINSVRGWVRVRLHG
jgi:para-aminobenzoate synthetase/4-amino-4-deoxychorismate lyase